MELGYKAWWAIKQLNMDLSRARLKRFLDLNEMEELRNDADSTHGSLALKAYQQNLYLEYYY